MSVPTVFLSAATVDLKPWRDTLADAFSTGCRVLVQDRSLGVALDDVKRQLVDNINESDCVIHLAGMGYGSDAHQPFPDHPDFRCSWTQFEYLYAHARGKDVIAFVCAPDLSTPGWETAEKGDATERERKASLQQLHRARVTSGNFEGTPLEGRERTLNHGVDSIHTLVKLVADAVRKLHKLGQAGQAAAAALDARRALFQIPAPPSDFTGRVADLAVLRALDPGDGALITGLRGMGGIGKTVLAYAIAHEWRGRFPDAQLLLDGRGTSEDPPSGADLLDRAIHALQPSAGQLPEDEPTLRALFHSLLDGRKALILLDNAAGPEQAKALAPPAGCGLIVTSRHGFALGGKARQHLIGRLPDDEAALFLREFHPDLSDADAAELTRLCAGLPLALRLAGSHLRLDADERPGGRPDVAGYLHALGSGRLATLDAEAADAGEIAISETLRLSEERLAEEEREAWRRLGVFAGSFDAWAASSVVAEAVAEEDRRVGHASHGSAEQLLARFVRRGMLDRAVDDDQGKGKDQDAAVAGVGVGVGADTPDRYRLHDLAAEYARARLEPESLAAARLAHARHYAAVGEEADQLYLKGEAVAGLALFDRERIQMEAAFAWLRLGGGDSRAAESGPEHGRDRDRDRVLLDLVDAVTYTGDLRFHPRQGIAWLEAQRDAARRAGNRKQEGAALGNLGNAHADLGDARRAIEFYEQHLEVAREIGDRRGEGNALGNLGLAHAALGDARRAIEFYEQALAVFREIGDRRGEGIALGNLGLAHADLGDARRAIEFYEQHLEVAREIGDRRGEGNALGNLGSAHAALGDARRAIEFHEQYLLIAREIGDRRGEGNALFNSAVALDSLGDRAEAIARAEAALRIFEAIEDPNAEKVRRRLLAWREA